VIEKARTANCSGFFHAGLPLRQTAQRAWQQPARPTQSKARCKAHGAQADELHLTPLELIARLAVLVPPPPPSTHRHRHRHRYFGVLAPHSPHRAAVTAMTQSTSLPTVQVQAEPTSTDAGEGARGAGNPPPIQTGPAQSVQPKRPAHDLWAVLIARIYEVFPLLCPICGGQMRIIAFITHGADIRQILNHIGVDAEPPRITPASGPPLWDGCDAQMGDGVEVEPDWDEAAQVAPDFEVDLRISWSWWLVMVATAVLSALPTLRGRAARGTAQNGSYRKISGNRPRASAQAGPA
jgi:hypothetical protein